MKPCKNLLAGAAALAALVCGGPVVAQTVQRGPIPETIEVTGARPVADAMNVIEQRYGVLIDYVDPQYADSQDTQLVRSVRGTPVRKPFLIPRVQTIQVRYLQVDSKPESIPYLSCNVYTWGCAPVTTWPEGGITGLIRQVLNQFATQGGPVFEVEKLNTSYGPRWEVFPEEVRDRSGRFAYQPNVLDTNIYIPKQRGTLADLLSAICDQLTHSSGHKVGIASAPANPFVVPAGELGAENVSAGEALADLMGRTLVLRLYYAPDTGMYYANIEHLPYREPPRPPPPPQPTVRPPVPRFLSPGEWLGFSHMPEGALEIQAVLAKMGYLRNAPTKQWDANAADAIRRFQAANGLATTGAIDPPTILKLRRYLPMVIVPNPPQKPPSLIYPQLANWLGTTPSGRKEVQEALAKAGFYSGPINGAWDDKTREALKAFQKANGITPAPGMFDEKTQEKLAPFLPKPN